MINHVPCAARDMLRPLSQDNALARRGIARQMSGDEGARRPQHVVYGRAGEWVFRMDAGAFVAGVHPAALSAGGRDRVAPGPMAQGYAGYCGAFVLDPRGFNGETMHCSAVGAWCWKVWLTTLMRLGATPPLDPWPVRPARAAPGCHWSAIGPSDDGNPRGRAPWRCRLPHSRRRGLWG